MGKAVWTAAGERKEDVREWEEVRWGKDGEREGIVKPKGRVAL